MKKIPKTLDLMYHSRKICAMNELRQRKATNQTHQQQQEKPERMNILTQTQPWEKERIYRRGEKETEAKKKKSHIKWNINIVEVC